MQLPRDAGGRSVEVYQALGLDGTYQNREVVREIPPTVRYQVTIHQWQVQSIAIDRTGKSPNVIEDVNMQGRGLGMFSLPPVINCKTARSMFIKALSVLRIKEPLHRFNR